MRRRSFSPIVATLTVMLAGAACGSDDAGDIPRPDMSSPTGSVIPGAPQQPVHQGEYNTQPAPTLAP